MMRILYLPSHYYPLSGSSGAAIVSYEIITRLSRHNEVLAIVSNTHDKRHIHLTAVDELSDSLTFIFPLSQVVEGIRLAKSFDPDVIISQYHPSDMLSYAARFISRSVRKPLIARSDDIWFVPFSKFSILSKFIYHLNFRVVKDSNFFLVNSTEHKLLVEQIYHRHEGIIIHPNGVDTLRFNPSLMCHKLRRELGLEDKKIVLYSGGVAYFYGLDLLPKAFALVAKEVSDARLVLSGLFGDQTQRKILLSVLRKCGIENKTIILPPVPYEHIHKTIALGDVCIGTLSSLPLNVGTVPTKVPQYMACGKPTVVARRGVSEDLVIHEKTGIAFNGDHQSLASWITKLLEDEKFARIIGKAARNHVEKNYNWSNLVVMLEELISHAAQKS